MKKNTTSVDKTYKLKSNATPISFTLPSRNTSRFQLLYFDEEQSINRPLRYARNQKSPFEDEQDGNFILEPVIFDDGFLNVPRTNPVLQQFLHYHPMNGSVFVEVDKTVDAAKEVEDLNFEVDALIEARQLSIEQLEVVSRVMFQRDVTNVSTAELRRDVLIYAKKEPRSFLEILNDPLLKLQSNVQLFFAHNLLQFRNGQREVWFNTKSNKKKMMSIPFGEDPYETVALFLKSDEGIEVLKFLEISLK
jgi:hypothetical protein